MNLSRAKLARWAKLLTTYFIGQGAAQLLQLVTGFLLIRWLTKDAYATLTLVIAIQGTSQALVELGISQALTAVIGKKIGDPHAVGRYIAACRYYRDRLLIIGSAVLLLVFVLIAPKYGWDEGIWGWLWLSVVLALVFQAWGAFYNPIFLLNQNLTTFYTINVGSGAMRLALVTLAHLFGVLTAPLALFYGALQACVAGWGAKELASAQVVTPDEADDLSTEKNELLGQAVPRMPSNIFNAFSGQITILLMAIFGTTASLAEIGALGRLGMLFIIFRQASRMLVVPYFSKIESDGVQWKVMASMVGVLVFSFGVSAVAYAFPQPLLLILGEGYQHLGYEIFLVVGTQALGLVSTIASAISVGRKYVFSWFAMIEVVPVVVVMVLGLALMDLSHLTNVLYYGLIVVCTRLVIKVFILCAGLRREIQA